MDEPIYIVPGNYISAAQFPCIAMVLKDDDGENRIYFTVVLKNHESATILKLQGHDIKLLSKNLRYITHSVVNDIEELEVFRVNHIKNQIIENLLKSV